MFLLTYLDLDLLLNFLSPIGMICVHRVSELRLDDPGVSCLSATASSSTAPVKICHDVVSFKRFWSSFYKASSAAGIGEGCISSFVLLQKFTKAMEVSCHGLALIV